MRSIGRFAAPLLALGCAPRLPEARGPLLEPPPSFALAEAAPAEAPLPWSAYLEEPTLHALIGEALERGAEAQLAAQEVARARADLRGAGARRLPSVSAQAAAGLTRFSADTMDGAGYLNQPIAGQPVPRSYPELGMGLEASWELSAWGQLRHLQASARARYLGSLAGEALVTAGVVADLATAWYELVALDRALAALDAAAARQDQALSLVRAQKEAGRVDELAVLQMAAALADTRAERVDAEQRRAELELSINLRAGRMPQPVARAAGALERPPLAPAVGLPAEALRRRPDVLAAEQRVAAAGFDLRAARAAFYPSLNLRAGLGLAAFQARYLGSPEAVGFSLGAGLVAPVINRGAILADFHRSEADEIDALVEYQRVLVLGVVEVQAQLEGLARAEARLAERGAQRAAALRAVEVSGALFSAGRASYVEVLVAEEAALAAERSMVAAELERCWRSIGLYRALGGGWAPRPADQPAGSPGGRSSKRR